MKRWAQYTKERFPLPVFLLLSCGYALSGLACITWPIPVTESFVASLLVMLFLFELRLMDEYKDKEKDKVAHPERPLPRGLITEVEVRRGIFVGLGVMLASCVVLAATGKLAAAGLYLVITIYLFLMYKEFFIGNWLGKRPFLYAVSHQPIGSLLALISIALFSPEKTLSLPSLAYAATTLGGFFAYEVGRKLNPNSHPILQTYVVAAGYAKTFVAFVLALAVACAGIVFMQMPTWILVIPIITACSFLALFFRPLWFKVVEGIATLNLVLCVWAGVILHFVK
jgi:4-hydroxybenzoate polyprenyltransferase